MEALDNSSDPNAWASYDDARRKLTAGGMRSALDVIYAALKQAGTPASELSVMDLHLDEKIIAEHEGAA
jgi:hypothetical protein